MKSFLSPTSLSLNTSKLGLSLAMLTLPAALLAQSVNFDSGSDDSFIRLSVLTGFGGTATYSFPETATGKGYRLQATSVAALGDSGTARTFSYHTNVYTDFYAAVDVADWDNSLNQAAVLGARLDGINETLSPCPLPTCPPGLGTLRGYICNYDANQHGASATSRLNGEFQINHLLNEGADNTLAVAEVTLVPHKPYRMVFTGKGSSLVARFYDYDDLTAPIVTLNAEDTDYTTGASGLIAFSRDGTTSDVTFDNYAAAGVDPDADIAPAIRHPVSGTPQVLTRVPAKRFTNFHSATNSVSFTATTFGTNLINVAATKVYLNDLDVSVALKPLPANASQVTLRLADGTLQPNTPYAARIELQDLSGTRKSTNTFWFDTFTEAYLQADPVKTVEVEDYNYTDNAKSGAFQLDPIPVSGNDANGLLIPSNGRGYFQLAGTQDIDYHVSRTSPENGWNEYRPDDNISTIQGGREEIEDQDYPPGAAAGERPNDHQRQQYATVNAPEYEVVHTEPGEWLNYTRKFTAGSYNVFLRVASFSPTQAHLSLVSGDVGTMNQTAAVLGDFNIPNDLMRINYRYVPLTSNGVPVAVSLGGTNTVRLAIAGTPSKDNQVMALNYLLFVPVATPSLALVSAATVTGPYSLETNAVIDTQNKSITVPQSGTTRFYQITQPASAAKVLGLSVRGANVVINYQ